MMILTYKLKELARRLPGIYKGNLSLTGLTFIEVILATALTTVIAIAVYSMLSNGLRIWQLVNQETPQIDVNLFFERLNTELKNSIRYQGIDFVGEENSLSFPVLVASQKMYSNEVSDILGRVRYFYEHQGGSIAREYTDYRQLSSIKKSGSRTLVKNINSFVINYYFYDQKKDAFFWVEEWPPQELKQMENSYPLAIRVVLESTMGNVTQRRTKTLSIPIGGITY